MKQDRRLSEAGRARKVAELDDEILETVCLDVGGRIAALGGSRKRPSPAGRWADAADARSTVVCLRDCRSGETPRGEPIPASKTNNESERTPRSPAATRKTGRTNKTLAGAPTRTVNVSALESLCLYRPDLTLSRLNGEISRWLETGQNCFAAVLAELDLTPSSDSVLGTFLPLPGG